MTGRAVTALLLTVVGLGATFGVRSYLQWRATGSTGYRGISGRPGSLAWWGGVLFVVAVVLILVAPVLLLLGYGSTLPVLDGVGIFVVGTLIAAASLASVLAAQRSMGDSWRVGVDESEQTTLVTAGIFQHVRNPIFTAMGGALTGLVLMVPTPTSIAALLALVVAVEIQVRVIEEPYLVRLHGGQYERYAARAGRLFPSVGRGISKTASGAASTPTGAATTSR